MIAGGPTKWPYIQYTASFNACPIVKALTKFMLDLISAKKFEF